MASSHCYSRRRRVKPVQSYVPNAMTREEEKLLQQAIENSKRMTQLQRGGRDLVVPFGPTFFPTIEEFEKSPLDYIEKIRPVAQKYGICKIVPPKGWNPPFSVDMKSEKKFQTKQQLLHRIQEGLSFGDGEEYSASSYVQMAMKQTQQYFSENVKDEDGNPTMTATLEYLENCYWDTVEISHEEYTVEYGNDVDSHEFGSGFPRSERGRGIQNVHLTSEDNTQSKMTAKEPKFGTDEFYKESYWNLNNIPNCPGSILQYIKVGINGINVPWMYFGNLFSTFCWHNEDNYLYSINYHHWGAPKLWYGVPGTEKDASGLEQVFKSYLSMKMRDVPDLLHHITTMFSPRLLQIAEVPVYKLIQHPGEFVVTFPMSFHGGFSLGPNVGEAVNFATNDWIVQGGAASERYRSFSRPSVFSHDRLTFTMAYHLDDQKSHRTCEMLLDELKRIMDEEISLRNKLLKNGIRDISKQVELPQNRFDELDEDSADYDDKRLCFACKHICFLSCVACRCSKSKVSCLRHSHFMCRCPTQDRFMMVWCTTEEMKKTYKRVKEHTEHLKAQEENVNHADKFETESTDNDDNFLAPGVLEDLQRHERYVVNVGEAPSSLQQHIPYSGKRLLHVGDQSMVRSNKSSPRKRKM